MPGDIGADESHAVIAVLGNLGGFWPTTNMNVPAKVAQWILSLQSTTATSTAGDPAADRVVDFSDRVSIEGLKGSAPLFLIKM